MCRSSRSSRGRLLSGNTRSGGSGHDDLTDPGPPAGQVRALTAARARCGRVGPDGEPSVTWFDRDFDTELALAPDFRTFVENLTASSSFDTEPDATPST